MLLPLDFCVRTTDPGAPGCAGTIDMLAYTDKESHVPFEW